MKFRRIYQENRIEAFQYDGDLRGTDGYYVPEWAVDAYNDGTLYYAPVKDDPAALFIKSLGSTMLVAVGDYVIKGDEGELYRYKPSIFEQVYEPVVATDH